MSRNDKHLALKLRKQGKAYNFISKQLGVPKSTLSDWFGSLKWSNGIKTELTRNANIMARKRMHLIAKANKERWRKWRLQYRVEAIREFPKLKNNRLFISGIMLYWAEGDNGINGSSVRLANIDSRIIRIFINFAEKICKVEKENIRMGLLLYPDLNERICKNFWNKRSGIPLSQFYKTQIIKGRHPTKRLQYGICLVKVGGRGLKEKIKVWIDLYARELMRV